jgi:hypothetical protein
METSLPSGGGLTFPGVAGFDRDDSDGGSSSVEFRLQGAECPARRGRSGVLILSFIYAFCCFTVMAFFLVFHRTQR